MRLYCIPGLGTDSRIFERLQFPQQVTAEHLRWIAPQPNETLPQYALRMAAQIDASTPFALLGYSLGGMLAAELHERLQPRRTLLLASVAGRHEFPPLLQLGRRLQVYRLLSGRYRIPIQYTPAWWMLGLRRPHDKQLLLQMLQQSSPAFTRWAVQAILTWERTAAPPGLVRIHGGNDRVFPLRYVQAQHVLPQGGHCLLLDHAPAVSALLQQELLQVI
ncbi:MAG: alpha/beta fold hydrolase [Lacibacter sp.]